MHTKQTILELLEKNDHAVERGIVAIFKRQTADEQNSDSTNANNGIGFSGCDAPLLSSFAKWINAGRKLTQGQMVFARKKIMKYARQLTEIANKGK